MCVGGSILYTAPTNNPCFSFFLFSGDFFCAVFAGKINPRLPEKKENRKGEQPVTHLSSFLSQFVAQSRTT